MHLKEERFHLAYSSEDAVHCVESGAAGVGQIACGKLAVTACHMAPTGDRKLWPEARWAIALKALSSVTFSDLPPQVISLIWSPMTSQGENVQTRAHTKQTGCIVAHCHCPCRPVYSSVAGGPLLLSGLCLRLPVTTYSSGTPHHSSLRQASKDEDWSHWCSL